MRIACLINPANESQNHANDFIRTFENVVRDMAGKPSHSTILQ